MPQINNVFSATTIGLLSRPGPASFSHKHPRTNRILQSFPAYRVHDASRVANPTGTTHHGALFELGHPNHQFDTPRQLTPRMLRELGEVLFRARKQSGTIHVFGVVDSESPLGSYRIFESIIRFLLQGRNSIALHAGVWAPTPREFRHTYNDLKAFTNRDNVTFASIFPTHILHTQKQTKQFIDGLHHNKTTDLDFPIHQPHILSPIEVTDDDIFLMSMAPARETHILRQSIEDRFPLNYVTALPYEYNSDQSIKKTLGQSKHILALANHPSYIEAYFGSELTHPYFETMIVESPTELLEMLISPHFGYTSAPHRTTVMLDEMSGDTFDWLLASYVRKNMTTPLLFHVVTPHQLQGNVVYSNRVASKNQPILHQDVHWYGT